MASFYLAGPIEYIDRAIAVEWRETAADILSLHGHSVFDPCRHGSPPPHNIVAMDLNDIRSADGILAHFPVGVPMTGTPMEIFFASRILDKPVYVWGHNKSPSPWLSGHCKYVVVDLDEAIRHILKDHPNKDTA